LKKGGKGQALEEKEHQLLKKAIFLPFPGRKVRRKKGERVQSDRRGKGVSGRKRKRCLRKRERLGTLVYCPESLGKVLLRLVTRKKRKGGRGREKEDHSRT